MCCFYVFDLEREIQRKRGAGGRGRERENDDNLWSLFSRDTDSNPKVPEQRKREGGGGGGERENLVLLQMYLLLTASVLFLCSCSLLVVEFDCFLVVSLCLFKRPNCYPGALSCVLLHCVITPAHVAAKRLIHCCCKSRIGLKKKCEARRQNVVGYDSHINFSH